jgi:hypothetical protein
MQQKSKTKDTITRRELCELTGLSLNTLNGRLLNYKYTQLVPERLNGRCSAYVYDRQKALEWIKEWNGEAKKEPAIKLMNLSVKWGKPHAIVQKLDNLEKQFYSQHITD